MTDESPSSYYVKDWNHDWLKYRIDPASLLSTLAPFGPADTQGVIFRFLKGGAWVVLHTDKKHWLLINGKKIWLGDAALTISHRRIAGMVTKAIATYGADIFVGYFINLIDEKDFSPVFEEMDTLVSNFVGYLQAEQREERKRQFP